MQTGSACCGTAQRREAQQWVEPGLRYNRRSGLLLPYRGRIPRCGAAPAGTLLELLLVLSIVAIALGLTGPGMAKLLSQFRSQAAMEGIVSLLALARQEAILRNHPVTVCAARDDGRCERDWSKDNAITAFIDSNEDGRLSPGETVLRQISWPLENAELSWRASLGRRYLRFEVQGGTWQNGTLYYCPGSRDARQARALVLSHSGRAYLPGDSNGDGIREDRAGRNLRC